MKSQPNPAASEAAGLSEAQATAQRQIFGRNEFSKQTLRRRFALYLKILQDPMGLMLLALAVIYFLLGESNEAILMLVAFVPVSAIDVFLELRAEKALSALRATFQPRAKVWRDGVLKDLPIAEIVPGDWIALEEGQTVPADGLLRRASNLSVSEASLTGESLPIEKTVDTEIFAGTSVLSGFGVYQVTQTGLRSKFGKIMELLHSTEGGVSPLQRKIHQLVSQLMKVAAILVIGLFVLEWARGKSILEALLVSLTFGMASVPEEFPLVFTLYLSLGAWRLAKKGVLVKSLPAVETLGSVDVICTDKTGTLTEGKFQLTEVIPFGDFLPEDRWKFALLACEPVLVDAMEVAILDRASTELSVAPLRQWVLVHDYAFEFDGKHMSHAWRKDSGDSLVAMKGAVEGVLVHCRDAPEVKAAVIQQTEELSSKGYRLLGLAGKFGPITGDRATDEAGMSFMAILAFSDPIRQSATQAVQTCQQQGIQIKMMTGDHPLTAHAIADRLGLIHSHSAIYTGAELTEMSLKARHRAFEMGAIFSRVSPEQKFELVETLKSRGLIVAMTGDGVNDAPALRVADIGISMGDRATDAARATGGMVLTKSDFGGVVYAITEGRRIFSNLRKSFSYLIAFHVPVVLLSFVPVFLNWGELLLPIHIILLELLVHPVSAFAFEGLPGTLGRGRHSIIDRNSVATAVLAGGLVSVSALVLFYLTRDTGIETSRSLALLTVLYGNVGFVVLEAGKQMGKRLWITVGVLLLSNLLFVLSPMVFGALETSIPELKWIAISGALGVISSLPSWSIRLVRLREKKA